MKTHFIAAAATILISLSGAAPGLAVDCQLANTAKPAMSFATAEKAPRTWKAGKVPRKLRAALDRIGRDTGKDTAGDPHPLDDVEFICDDWIAICANDDCTHGVLECDGDCIEF